MYLQELRNIIEMLSEDEAERLLPLFQNVLDGERFWSDDAGKFYNEYVKTRNMNLQNGHTGMISEDLNLGEFGYFSPVPLPENKIDPDWLPLPVPNTINKTLTETLRDRRSVRNYSAAPVDLLELATILEHAFGVTGAVAAYGFDQIALRSFPSTGGLQSPDVYLFVRNVSDVDPGLYFYHPYCRRLELLESRDYWSELQPIFLNAPMVAEASVILCSVGNYERIRWKYGARAYRYMCMDIGFSGQNLQLAASALGLGSCPIAAFVEDNLEHILRVDDKEEYALLAWSLGYEK